MTTDFRALCAELLAHAKKAQSIACHDLWFGDEDDGLFNRAEAALAQPQPPADGEVGEVVRRLKARARIEESDHFPWTNSLSIRAADLLERLDRYEQALSAVMPADFKDWWQNSKEEWPEVAAGVIKSLRKQTSLVQGRAELTDAELYEIWVEDEEGDFQDCRRFARAVLARWGNHPVIPDSSLQPPADGEVGEPSDDELESFLVDVAAQNGDIYWADPKVLARAVLARWGTATPQPPADGEVGE